LKNLMDTEQQVFVLKMCALGQQSACSDDNLIWYMTELYMLASISWALYNSFNYSSEGIHQPQEQMESQKKSSPNFQPVG
jgi:hypothetical protein